MREFKEYIFEKLKIDKDIEIKPFVGENIKWGIINMMEDFYNYNDFYKSCKYELKNPKYFGNQIIISVCFKGISGAMWYSLKRNFVGFIDSRNKNYLKNKKIKKYNIPPVQKDNAKKINFYIMDE